jgi:peptidylprolyl isomerase
VLKLKDSVGRHIAADEVVKLHCVTYYIDSTGHRILLSSTHDGNMPLVVRAGSKMKMMGLNLGLTFLRNGESATIIVPAKPEYSSLAGDRMIKQFYHDVTILDVMNYPFYDGAGKDTVTTASGLKYLVIRKGNGQPVAAPAEVSTAYTGYVLTSDGRKQIFDASRESGRLLNFELGKHQVIEGYEEGLAGMSAGEARLLIIPAALAYGERGVPDSGIPANSTLFFDIEMIQYKTLTDKIHD